MLEAQEVLLTAAALPLSPRPLAAAALQMYAPKGTFDHWAYKGWDWIINSTADWGIAMSLINGHHWAHSIRVLTKVVERYGKHPAIWGLSPVNEVGAWTPMDVLRKFYWEAYTLVRKGAPHWIYVMDSSFRGSGARHHVMQVSAFRLCQWRCGQWRRRASGVAEA